MGRDSAAAMDAARELITLGCALMLVLVLAGCIGSPDWQEQVQLADGRLVLVERKLLIEGGGDEWAVNRSGSKPKTYQLLFTVPELPGQNIEWKSVKKSPQTWPEIPLVLNVEDGLPVIYTLVAISAGCETYSRYVYQNGTWVEARLPEKFPTSRTNLLFGSLKDLPRVVNVDEKTKRNSAIGYRAALKQVGPDRKICG